MRTLFSGEVRVEYGQLHVCSDESHALERSFAGQRAGLCGGAVPGHLLLLTGTHTGRVPITIELHEAEPPLETDVWEDIVEVSFRPAADEVVLAEWESDWYPLPLAALSYRVRYCCRGMDGVRGAVHDAGEPPRDEYLLRFWPSPPSPDRVVEETSRTAAYWHAFAREQPRVPTSEEQAEAERQAREAKEKAELRQQRNAWGGRLPSDRLREVRNKLRKFQDHPKGIVGLDAALVHAIDAAGAEEQRALACWAAHRACAAAGLREIDWVARGLAELDLGKPFSPPLDDSRRLRNAVFADARVPRPHDGTPGLPQAAALAALSDAAAPDPLKAALDALLAAAVTYDTGYPHLFAEVRHAFPTTATEPKAEGIGPASSVTAR
ncbi:hypothetical protein [Streptomyces sp. WMMB303]|uniref:hypothetical protein n=1 Tax=Streptomyces sp. WMMB303 TaxID=3034154 RepID=UPI0023EDC043|nr:hypothetical protein [Streptomyces sp. WMMB303]MDF4251841.1 hypothetical protein [Streptomyces sp. WMMB303]MDF4254529.1 hypothetical protein [Streptomyces sp. WMMB303]